MTTDGIRIAGWEVRTMRIISKKELEETLEKHKKWLNGEGGEKANLRFADLQNVDLRGADLRSANLRFANLRGADLRGAALRFASLRGASLREASLREADLRGVDLHFANLQGADLCSTDLRGVQRPWLVYLGSLGNRDAGMLYFADYDNIRYGCWNNCRGGTLAEFKARIDEVYPADDKTHLMHRVEYLSAISIFKSMRKTYVKSLDGEYDR